MYESGVLMRATCNKREDNFITYHSTREKIINNVREWEKLNPEKRKEYTIKYYKTEKGHRKRLEQQKRYREKKKLIKANEKLKNDKMELLKKIDMFQKENEKLNHYKLLYQKLKDRNDNGIEYIKRHMMNPELMDEFEYISTSPKKLLEILKGNNEEQI